MSRPEIRIDPSGRPLERAGFEAVYALGLVLLWILVMGGLFALMGQNREAAVGWPFYSLAGLAVLCWAGAYRVVDRQGLIWPGSALGILGPLSLGFALALSTPELRAGAFQERLAIVSGVAGIAMIPFLVRFRLPGLVSPIITFTLVGVFLTLYGADMERLRQMEGFSPRGIVAALLQSPVWAAGFGLGGVAALVTARRLDFSGDNFGLAMARPLHLVGAGVTALVAGRALALLPAEAAIPALLVLALAITLWAVRVNRAAVMFAGHFAMVKPLVLALGEVWGFRLDLHDWVRLLSLLVVAEIAVWPALHWLSQRAGWTLGPGGRVPPVRRGWVWRYWPYA